MFANIWDAKRILREITLLRKLNFKSIIKLYDIIIEVHFLFLIILKSIKKIQNLILFILLWSIIHQI